ncbi:succinyl-diaminopimelate desuccinylase [Helicobacter sp. MIT 14-3879]|uniref:succinyl-diaminopimelate desuccinylase n=1 Tax=Helicobacter sp. MIT 14-3879 TaxID=2040649 RepID=UPI000E1EC54D|nr:succinyl-diaminopimelate desuccinylase [Helicobacter sp. MIT 14-3879]RDU63537.1 succinyl-diaminopimelate desuccinylase [Helicobacter sp. MIT 14-3879]
MEEIDFLVYMIKKQSITPNECGIYSHIKNILNDFKVIEQNINGVKNIFLYKDFRDSNSVSKTHLCFAGHIDVVPSGEGWSVEPFSGIIKNNMIYGRGVQDMKGGIVSFIYALKNIKNFNGILSILLTSDEEGDGIYGTKVMLDELKNKNLLPNYAIVAEPTCTKLLGDTIKIGRRGSINGTLVLYGIQGHVAYPQKCKNPIDLISNILPNISSKQLDSGDENFSPSMIVITDIRAGIQAVNVTPSKLKMMFNVRNSPLITKETLKEYLQSLFKGMDYTLELKQSSFPFITHSPKLIESTIKAIESNTQIKPQLSTSGGTSDARYFSEFGVDVLEFGLVNDRIHAVDECARVEDIIKLKEIFISLINNINAICR